MIASTALKSPAQFFDSWFTLSICCSATLNHIHSVTFPLFFWFLCVFPNIAVTVLELNVSYFASAVSTCVVSSYKLISILYLPLFPFWVPLIYKHHLHLKWTLSVKLNDNDTNVEFTNRINEMPLKRKVKKRSPAVEKTQVNEAI